MKEKKTIGKKIMMIAVMVVMMIQAAVFQVNAESMVEAGTLNAQWAAMLIGIGILLAVLCLWKLKSNNLGVVLAIIGVVMAVAGAAAFIDFGVDADTDKDLSVTESVDWTVSINSAGTDNNFNDNENTFTSMIYVNKTAGTILDSGNSTYTDPVFNWTVSPDQTVGLTENVQQATGSISVSNPSYAFSDADATDTLYLFSKASSGKYDLTWTADGVTAEESDLVTVSLGNSEYVTLEPEYRDAAIKYLDTGDSISWSINVCGEVYTATLTVVNAWGTVS